jgi:hypothetical protein
MDIVPARKQTVDSPNLIARVAHQARLKGSNPPAVVDSFTRGQ